MRATMLRALVVAIISLLGPIARADFALHDGDRVVFLGDSITAARTYGKIIENYTLLRFPMRKVQFVNAGWGGDTAAGGFKRLGRDVFVHQPTVVIVAYGVNDIGWGLKGTIAQKQKYLDGVQGIVTACQRRKVRVFLCSAAVTSADPEKSEESFLQKMCDEGMDLAKSLGEEAIDVQRTMREIQKRIATFNSNLKDVKGKMSLHQPDGIHLNDLGHLAMAFAILKGLGAPADVSSAVVDANEIKLIEAKGCAVTKLTKTEQTLAFTRLDEGLPINLGLFGALHFRFVPVTNELNRYMLTVLNLKPGKYTVDVEDRALGRFSHNQLHQGMNIASLTANAWQPGGPWDAQATLLRSLTEARHEVAVADRLGGIYVPNHPARPGWSKQSAAINSQIIELQRALVRPAPYRFVIEPAE